MNFQDYNFSYPVNNEVPDGFHRVDVLLNEWFVVPVRYTFDRFLGTGSQGFVARFYDSVIQSNVTIKKIVLPEDTSSRTPFKRAIRELHCMKTINHPNIIKLYNAFTPYRTANEMREFYIVREYMAGTMRKIENAEIGHDHVRKIIHDICRGVKHLHQFGIAHRDLKPENILCSRNADVKLCDFGHSNIVDQFMQTPYIVMRYYRAPEILCHVYKGLNTNVDVWSIGCILGELLFLTILFRGLDHIDQYRRIVERIGSPKRQFLDQMPSNVRDFVQTIAHYNERSVEEKFPTHEFAQKFREEPEQCIEARDLLNRMLVIDPNDRLTIDQVLQHPYLRPISDEYDFDDTPQDERVRSVYTWQAYFDGHSHRQEIFNILSQFQERPFQVEVVNLDNTNT